MAGHMGSKIDTSEIIAQTWENHLRETDTELTQLINVSEEEFMAIGKKLFDFSAQSKDISEIALHAANMLSGKEIGGIIASLHQKLSTIERYLNFSMKELKADINILNQIESYFKKITFPLQEFKKILKRLNVLSISIRIESTRLSNNQNKFDSLADDVIELSGFAKDKMLEINNSVQKAREYIKELLIGIKTLKEQKFLDTHKKMEIIFNALKAITQRNEESSKITVEISRRLDDNANNISEIVTALQFHDIVRQNVEHVKEAIDDLINELIASHTGNNGEVPTEVFQHVGSICDLQNALLDKGNTDIVKAVNKVIDRLNKIVENVFDISSVTKKITEDVNKDSELLIGETKVGTEYVNSSLISTVNTNNEIVDIIKNTIDIVKKMNHFIEDIDEIGSEIDLIAVNGIIHAAHMGEEGAPLSVLADSAQHLSINVRKQIGEISGLLHKISDTADTLRLGMSSEKEKAKLENSVNQMTKELLNFMDKLTEICETLNNSLLSVEISTISYSREIEDTVSNITVHNTFNRGIYRAMKLLGFIVAKTKQKFGFSTSEKTKSIMNEIKNRYTMFEERDVHDNFAKQYSNGEGKGEIESALEVGEDTDNNIELF